jgi:phosphoglycerate dehydrogenase-like enzyme
VTDREPLPAGHPFWTMPGVFITPHEAAFAPVSVTRMISRVRDQAERFLNGAPLLHVISGTY